MAGYRPTARLPAARAGAAGNERYPAIGLHSGLLGIDGAGRVRRSSQN